MDSLVRLTTHYSLAPDDKSDQEAVLYDDGTVVLSGPISKTYRLEKAAYDRVVAIVEKLMKTDSDYEEATPDLYQALYIQKDGNTKDIPFPRGSREKLEIERLLVK